MQVGKMKSACRIAILAVTRENPPEDQEADRPVTPPTVHVETLRALIHRLPR
jgi:hypothetical protein